MIFVMMVLGCGDRETADTGCSETHGLTWDGWGLGFMTTYCRACHSAESSDRRGAPEGVDFDSQEDVLSWRDRIGVRVLDEQTMPVGGGIVEDDLILLNEFLACSELP